MDSIKNILRESLLQQEGLFDEEFDVSMGQTGTENSFIGRIWDTHGPKITDLINSISNDNPNLHRSTIISLICKILESLDIN